MFNLKKSLDDTAEGIKDLAASFRRLFTRAAPSIQNTDLNMADDEKKNANPSSEKISDPKGFRMGKEKSHMELNETAACDDGTSIVIGEPSPPRNVSMFQWLLTSLFFILIIATIYTLIWTQDKHKQQMAEIAKLQKAVEEVKNINIVGQIKDLRESIGQIKETDMTKKIDETFVQLREEIKGLTELNDKKLKDFSEDWRILQDENKRIRDQLEKIRSDLQVERRLSNIQNDIDAIGKKKTAAFDTTPSYYPQIPTVIIDSRKIYRFETIDILYGQVQITLLSSTPRSASFSIKLIDQKPETLKISIGERREFEYDKEAYFFTLLSSTNDWAEISIVRKI